MSLYWSTNVTIVFPWWNTTTILEYVVSCIALVALSTLYEWLSTCKYNIAFRMAKEPAINGENEHLLHNGNFKRPPFLNVTHSKLTALHVIQLTLSYFIMLVIMTYNIGLIISAIAGYGIGFYFFGALRAKEPASCHV